MCECDAGCPGVSVGAWVCMYGLLGVWWVHGCRCLGVGVGGGLPL